MVAAEEEEEEEREGGHNRGFPLSYGGLFLQKMSISPFPFWELSARRGLPAVTTPLAPGLLYFRPRFFWGEMEALEVVRGGH